MVHALTAVRDIERVMDEAARIARKGGIVAIGDSSPSIETVRKVLLQGKKLSLTPLRAGVLKVVRLGNKCCWEVGDPQEIGSSELVELYLVQRATLQK